MIKTLKVLQEKALPTIYHNHRNQEMQKWRDNAAHFTISLSAAFCEFLKIWIFNPLITGYLRGHSLLCPSRSWAVICFPAKPIFRVIMRRGPANRMNVRAYIAFVILLGNVQVLRYHFLSLSRPPPPLCYQGLSFGLPPPPPPIDNIILGQCILIK